MTSPFSFLGAHLKSKNGDVPVSVLDSAPAVAIYFSAHWCPPCRQFTPVLADWYEEVNESGKQVEIVFVSLDQSQEQYQDYFNSMPWLSASFDPATTANIRTKISFSGIPYLVVMNKDGSVKHGNGRNDVSNQGPACVASWKN